MRLHYVRNVSDRPSGLHPLGTRFSEAGRPLPGHTPFWQSTSVSVCRADNGRSGPWDGVDLVAAAERGLSVCRPAGIELGVGLVPIRSPQAPYRTRSQSYDLEYGTDTLEIHTDAISPRQGPRCRRPAATGGTIDACCRLVEKAGGQVAACLFLMELGGLGGAEKISRYAKISLLRYD